MNGFKLKGKALRSESQLKDFDTQQQNLPQIPKSPEDAEAHHREPTVLAEVADAMVNQSSEKSEKSLADASSPKLPKSLEVDFFMHNIHDGHV